MEIKKDICQNYWNIVGLVHWDDRRDGVREGGRGFWIVNTCTPLADLC